MTKEQTFLSKLAKIILDVFDKPEMKLTKEKVCADGHFSPKMMKPERLLSMRCDTFMRLMLYLALLMTEQEFHHICRQMAVYIFSVANDDEDDAYDIIDSHAGSPVKT